MSALMVRADWPLFMHPGPQATLSKMWDQTMDTLESMKENYFHVDSTTDAFIAEVGGVGLGLAQRKPEGRPGILDKPAMGRTMTYVFPAWSLGCAISREAQDDDKRNVLVPLIQRELARAMFETMEEDAADQVNSAFTLVGWENDGVPLFSTSHPILKDGSTASNASPTSAALSISSLDIAMTALRTTRNETGRFMNEITPKYLDIHPALLPDALRILKTEKVLGSNFNDANLYYGMLQPRANPRFAYQNRWMIRADGHQWKWFNRIKPEFKPITDPISETLIVKAYARWGRGASDWRGVYGSDAP